MRNLRKKFQRPKKSWNIEYIEEIGSIKKKYGLKTTKELYIAAAVMRGFRVRARKLIAVANKEEEKILIDKLVKLGMLKHGSGLDDVLALTVTNVLERRLQTLVFNKGMATSINHARQLIAHGRVSIDGVRIKFPSYIVQIDEEEKIGWYKGAPKKSEGPKTKAALKRESEVPEEEASEIIEEAESSEAVDEKAEENAE